MLATSSTHDLKNAELTHFYHPDNICSSPPFKRHCSPSTSVNSSPATVISVPPPTPPPPSISATIIHIPINRIVNKPAMDFAAIAARNAMAKYMRRVYIDFVLAGTFMDSDVDDSKKGLLMSPEEDPMGVVAAAISIMRSLYSGDSAKDVHCKEKFMQLELCARHYMAAALYIAYKAKSEDTWKGGIMSRAIFSRFVTREEYPTAFSRVGITATLVRAEYSLLNALPVFSLIDGNIQSAVESQLDVMMQTSETGEAPLVTETASFAVLACFGYYYHVVTCVTDTELVEELCAEHGIGVVAMAFVEIGLASMIASQHFKPHELPDARLVFNRLTSMCALRIISAAVKTDLDRSNAASMHDSLQALTKRSTIDLTYRGVQVALDNGPV